MIDFKLLALEESEVFNKRFERFGPLPDAIFNCRSTNPMPKKAQKIIDKIAYYETQRAFLNHYQSLKHHYKAIKQVRRINKKLYRLDKKLSKVKHLPWSMTEQKSNDILRNSQMKDEKNK